MIRDKEYKMYPTQDIDAAVLSERLYYLLVYLFGNNAFVPVALRHFK